MHQEPEPPQSRQKTKKSIAKAGCGWKTPKSAVWSSNLAQDEISQPGSFGELPEFRTWTVELLNCAGFFSAHVLLEIRVYQWFSVLMCLLFFMIPNRWLRRRLLHSETQASAMLQPKAVLATEISGCGICLMWVFHGYNLHLDTPIYRYRDWHRGRPGPESMHPSLLRWG